MNFSNKSFLEKLSPQSFTITITNCQNVKEVDNLQLGEKNSSYLDADSKVKIQNFVPIFRQCRQLFFPWFILLPGQKKEKKQVCKVYYPWDQIHLLLKDGPDGLDVSLENFFVFPLNSMKINEVVVIFLY